MIATHQINHQRLWKTLMELGEIGSNPNRPEEGVTRLSLSLEDLKARQYTMDVMREAGLEVRVDSVGNVIGKLVGTDPLAPVVITGSHVDTVIQGGKFDGALGVLGAIEAVRSIIESGLKLTHSIEVISFTDEEGTRFGTGYIGSKAMVGCLEEDTFELKDENGITYAEAFKQAHLDPANYKLAQRSEEEVKAYIEMHIEQGRVLEDHQLSVGVVTDIQGPIWMEVQFQGHPDHAGATPMNMRRDAGLAMAELMIEVEKTAKKHGGVGTVGKVHIEPGGVNIIPGKSTLSIDLRHVNIELRANMVKELHQSISGICEKRNLTVNVELKKEVDPTSCSKEIARLIEESCAELQVPTMKLQCGAGHDSLIMTKLTKMGMIFVRSIDGLSHNPKEWTEKEDCMIGTQVLLNTLVKLAK
ncbi:Zn-dependent hydrolase [Halalkalibacter alkalisediminis]|uniref:Zn-dependent hydrolase n=1 Tax=Halalkalibacter alkalisediminis TaxID=935616 RepID=A0ABV6NDU0_9BACI|nr:Zn-dependent hydrolase [Halalkalibacter alkalisediminis]